MEQNFFCVHAFQSPQLVKNRIHKFLDNLLANFFMKSYCRAILSSCSLMNCKILWGADTIYFTWNFQKHPLKLNQFNRQNSALWLNNLAQMKQKGGMRVGGMGRGGFKNMMPDNQGPGNMPMWNQVISQIIFCNKFFPFP